MFVADVKCSQMADCSKFADRQRQSFCLRSCCAYTWHGGTAHMLSEEDLSIHQATTTRPGAQYTVVVLMAEMTFMTCNIYFLSDKSRSRAGSNRPSSQLTVWTCSHTSRGHTCPPSLVVPHRSVTRSPSRPELEAMSRPPSEQVA